MPTLTGYSVIDVMIGLIIFAVSFIIGFFAYLSPSVALGIE